LKRESSKDQEYCIEAVDGMTGEGECEKFQCASYVLYEDLIDWEGSREKTSVREEEKQIFTISTESEVERDRERQHESDCVGVHDAEKDDDKDGGKDGEVTSLESQDSERESSGDDDDDECVITTHRSISLSETISSSQTSSMSYSQRDMYPPSSSVASPVSMSTPRDKPVVVDIRQTIERTTEKLKTLTNRDVYECDASNDMGKLMDAWITLKRMCDTIEDNRSKRYKREDNGKES
jgi:hypothetical protein